MQPTANHKPNLFIELSKTEKQHKPINDTKHTVNNEEQ